MSDETKANIERALVDHLVDEAELEAGEMITEWLLLSVALPPDGDLTNSIIIVTTPGTMMQHHAQGLAFQYLYKLEDEEE